MTSQVLIIDDSLTVRMDLSEALQAAGFSTLPTNDLQNARAALQRERFALIILDVLLPDGDGIDFLGELKQSPATRDLPVMLLSTEVQVRNRIRGLRTGADEYIGKPYDCGYVVARARELLRGRMGMAPDTGTVILVVDDSATFRAAATTALEDAGYRVITAASGEEGLQAAVNYRPAAVLVDNRLPGMDGASVVRRMREDAALRRIPCLLLTASEEGTEELRALEAGADGFALKDQDFAVLLARLAALLRTVSTPSALDQQSKSFHGPKKILAVNANTAYLEELAANLRQEGYDLVLTQSEEESMELLAIEAVDCILLDVLMPGQSFTEICRRIKSTPRLRDIPLLMLTEMNDLKAMIAGINSGADDFIPKSNDFDVIRARIRAALRRKQVEDENRSVREQILRKEMETKEARARQELAETRAALLSELQKSEERVQIAAEAAELGIWYWDLNTQELIWTDRCKALFGLTQNANLGYRTFLNCLHPDDRDRVDGELRQSLSLHRELESEYRVVWPDGSTHWLVMRGRGLHDENGNPIRWTGVAMDVTDRRRTQEALIRSEKLASVGRMAATMAHEINNPLEAVMNALFLLSCDDGLSGEARGNLEIAERELNRVAHITKQTLGFYRENSRPIVFELAELVDDLLNLYSRKLSHKNIVVRRQWRVSGQMCGISGEVRQIASNLISNAIDAVGSHGNVYLRISPSEAKQAIRFTVADDGVGIRPEDMPCIFEPFFTTKKDVGTGLGLWVTKEIVDKHGGTIRVRSRFGRGTVFTVRLPLNAQIDGAEADTQAASAT